MAASGRERGRPARVIIFMRECGITEDVAELVPEIFEAEVLSYHSKMPLDNRKATLKVGLGPKVAMLVSTGCIGTSTDIDDITFIVHLEEQ